MAVFYEILLLFFCLVLKVIKYKSRLNEVFTFELEFKYLRKIQSIGLYK